MKAANVSIRQIGRAEVEMVHQSEALVDAPAMLFAAAVATYERRWLPIPRVHQAHFAFQLWFQN